MSEFSIKENINIFKCPVCGKRMKMRGLASIVCAKQHSFDLSKSGYVNLLLNPSKNDYDKAMLRSRNQICKLGFFDPLLEKISSIIAKETQDKAVNGIKILDAGCGEGSHLAQVTRNLHGMTTADFLGAGIDISKEGIQIASKEYPGHIWCVADLAQIPFLDKQFNIVLNILAPSNYEEFRRVVREDGILVKVVPGSNYLSELRSAFYNGSDKQIYSNERVIKHFGNNFRILDIQQIQYNRVVNREGLELLIKMTPLSWGASDERIQMALDTGINTITVDYSIIIGKAENRKPANR